ncbi:MAG: HTTM domain-containing protein [Maribacter sp.]|nr:HTTM domain-containing protein [Maribacter sp.]
MCKLMFVLVFVHSFYGYLSDPFLPFLPFLDNFHKFPGVFEYFQKAIFAISGILLLLNFRVKSMAIVLGLCIILALLSSKPLFRNHLFICGCVFLLAGLSDKNKNPWLLYIQLSIVYLGAATNKLLQLDWWTGQFMHNWLLIAIDSRFYSFTSTFLPEMLLAKVISWVSMLVEIIIGVLLLFKKTHPLVIWLIILFHSMIFTMTSTRFGHFFEDILIFLLVFLNWPKGNITVAYKFGELKLIRIILHFINWDRKIICTPTKLPNNVWLKVNLSDRVELNEVGLRSLFLYTPGFYICMFFLDLGIRFLFLHPLEHILVTTFLWSGILFFLPIRWRSTIKLKNLEPINY